MRTIVLSVLATCTLACGTLPAGDAPAALTRLTEGTRVSVAFDRTPLDGVCDQLARLCGQKIVLAPLPEGAGDARSVEDGVTLELKGVPMWEAIESLRRAGSMRVKTIDDRALVLDRTASKSSRARLLGNPIVHGAFLVSAEYTSGARGGIVMRVRYEPWLWKPDVIRYDAQIVLGDGTTIECAVPDARGEHDFFSGALALPVRGQVPAGAKFARLSLEALVRVPLAWERLSAGTIAARLASAADVGATKVRATHGGFAEPGEGTARTYSLGLEISAFPVPRDGVRFVGGDGKMVPARATGCMIEDDRQALELELDLSAVKGDPGALEILLDAPCAAADYLLRVKADKPALAAQPASRLLSPQLLRRNLKVAPDLLLSSLPGSTALATAGHAPSFSPDGTRIVYADAAGAGLKIKSLAGGDIADLAPGGKDAAWSPDGRFIAYVREDESDGAKAETAWVVSPAGSGARKVAVGGCPRWSADGKTLYVHARNDEKILAVDIDAKDAAPRVFCEKPRSRFFAVSPDGARIAFGGAGELVIVDRASDAVVAKSAVPGSTGLTLAWSPDGTLLAFGGVESDTCGVSVFDVAAGKALSLIKGAYTHPAWSADGKRLAFDMRAGTRREVWAVDIEAAVAMRRAPSAKKE